MIEGFKVESFVKLNGWRDIAVEPGASVERCPCDGADLSVLCAFAGDDQQMRVGWCESCGHVTYMDRPSSDWWESFYRSEWDRAGREKPPQIDIPSPIARIVEGLSVDRSRPVLEIGCAFGSALARLDRNGFTHVMGVEPSQHRAYEAQRKGFDVLPMRFESATALKALKEFAPYSVIASSHVLEHIDDVDAVARCASELQDIGDYFVVQVPNQMSEPSMGVLFFLPHAHSFTISSLCALMRKRGYALATLNGSTVREITAVFRKSSTGIEVEYMEMQAPVKLRSSLQWNAQDTGLLHWSSVSDWTSRQEEPEQTDGGRRRTMQIAPITVKRTQIDAPEIQFDGPIRLCVK